MEEFTDSQKEPINAEEQKLLGVLGDKYYFAHNYKQAVYWYHKAAEQGHANAQYNLCIMYDNGDGVDKNIYEARKWYQLAADQSLELAIQALERLKQ